VTDVRVGTDDCRRPKANCDAECPSVLLLIMPVAKRNLSSSGHKG
jgi:hypothetical protein